MPKRLKWSCRDDKYALEHGWTIKEPALGILTITRTETWLGSDKARFNSDLDAAAYVRERSEKGDQVAQKAIKMVYYTESLRWSPPWPLISGARQPSASAPE